MHLTFELQTAITYFHQVALNLLEIAGNDEVYPQRRLQQADLWELMQCSASVYHLAQNQLDAWPPAPKLRLVPKLAPETDDRNAESNLDEATKQPTTNAPRPPRPRP
ncbi:hypothetical protein DFR29_103300 [Tahibacter aquaticus]|uniref:Uncharacterized protein n=1 Tax=Tahibacter aquaticus TaxID=520092 RepID=A0A4R6Z544_9GAMM|nr:hypothetical protein [Tahibacter aquaticus]TDR46764.1 hypothetical protein DFR29_103300 [Tahibacter aquaticus]